MIQDLPIYDIVLNEDNQGVGMISLVDDPAIKVNWIKLAKENSLNFKTDKEKQMLFGPFLIPDMLIYRSDTKNGEYYVRFSKEQIDKIATKFNEDLNNKNINFQHTNEKVDAFVSQNWIIENEQDKSRMFGFDLPEGTWFGGVKVKDEAFWLDKVKNEEVKGFSVEILADLELSLKNKENIMEKQIKLGKAILKGGVEVYYDGEFGMGSILYVDEALTELAPDADHVLEDGTIVTTKDGEVVEIKVSSVEEQNPEDLAVEPVADTAAPQAQALTAEEVSLMIDSRFADIMEEITALKTALESNQNDMNSFRSEVSDKFSSTPAAASIKQKEVSIDAKFTKMENRIKEFAKNK